MQSLMPKKSHFEITVSRGDIGSGDETGLGKQPPFKSKIQLRHCVGSQN